MKINKIVLMMLGGALLATSCDDLNHQEYDGGALSTFRLQESNAADTAKAQATFQGMFIYLGQPQTTYGGTRPDDWGLAMSHLSTDLEGADIALSDNGYNWFSVADELTSRNANYANPYIRYVTPYRLIGAANQVIASINEESATQTQKYQLAQARALIAYAYLHLAPYFQFAYDTNADSPCVPIIADSLDASNNPRATVRQVYQVIIDNLNYAVENLAGFTRSSKQDIDQNVAYGLRARANLYMGNYAAAASDAEKAMEGYTPATREEVSTPGFCDDTQASTHNWIWSLEITEAQASMSGYATAPAWIGSFSGDSYSAATSNYAVINKLLYDKIPTTDIRHGWWLDENKHSDNWANVTWNDATGDAIADLTIDGTKEVMPAYTNIKFGQKAGIGSTNNMYDFPLLRYEEMLLTQIEGLAKSGNEAQARQLLENWVKTNRDPNYSSTAGGRTLADEIWYQRRVELWGEGFYTADAKRLHKPIVRFHQGGETNFADAYQFNIAPDDGWLNMRFPRSEMDNNHAIVDNEGGAVPVAGQNGNLRDGVTD